ncbi:helix-turn-helix domain-containing protein [Clostridium boliviensis]|uniref:Stage 0 sporulation protein A homolog n=1 Tax=Clostridium boliviensis TaxID=318465 RepID=A0ABU4GLG4_9CLOT|nr:helix-turn-helix domain-containing protein [Clostridium boliviensis]MDW2798467.1 helix-turn-helix domain-containing protein [Clostridium boliviensis]
MISVLIVDDDMVTVDVIKDSTRWDKLGIDEVYIAYNVSGGKKILEEKNIDIIISDIEMPKESGLDLLKWVRNKKIDSEFLLLTCHESFSYAADAIQLNAAAYLTKPFDIDIMEMTLRKIVDKLVDERNLKKSSEYGIWMEKNLRLMKIDFWKRVIEGNFSNRKHLRREIEDRHLNIATDVEYTLVFSKLSNIDADIERFGKSVFEFILEGFHSELLMSEVENESVVKLYAGNTLNFITVSQGTSQEKLREGCNELTAMCKHYFKGTLTCCISNFYDIMELPKVAVNLEQLLSYYVSHFGKVFLEKEVEFPTDNKIQIINLEKLVDLVEKKEKAKVLHYFKNIFGELSAYNNLNKHSLYLMQQEIVQVVYADLMKQGIQATKLFHDTLSIKMSDQAVESTVDMIRWVNYLLGKTFQYEEEIARFVTIIDKINDFIHKHYREEITRNEIAGQFYLTPSYLAKLYKRKTGVNIKDYINEYRIEKAKELLKSGVCNVGDVAEKVGFDNFSYFSTLFKKITGVSPKEYRNL